MAANADNHIPYSTECQIVTTVNDALQALRRDPDAEIRSGGTWFMDKTRLRRQETEQRPIVAIHAVRDLRKIVKREVDIEIGAAVPCSRLRELGTRFLPEILLDALDDVGPPPVRNVATIGGSLCIPRLQLPIGAVLQLIDARVEIRRQGNTRTIPLSQLRDANGDLRLTLGELVTRIRIPRLSWNRFNLYVFGRPYPENEPSLTVATLAQTGKSVLNELRCLFMIDGRRVIRPTEAAADLAGRTLPLTERDRRALISAVERDPAFGENLDDLGRWRASNGLRLFLKSLS